MQTFDTIGAIPGIGREYHAFSTRMRIHTHRSLVIIHMIKADHILIVRVLGARQDWQRILKDIDT